MENDNQLYNGTVVWFNSRSGIGFIQWSKDGQPQKDMFVYYSDIDVPGFKIIKKDQIVSFNIGFSNDKRPKAINVKPLT